MNTHSKDTKTLIEVAEINNFAHVFFDLCQDAVVITTADIHNPIITYVNAAFSRMTGYTKSEVIGHKPTLLQGERTNRDMMKRLKSCLIEGQAFQGATTNYRKDGRAYHVQLSIYPCTDEAHRPNGFIAIQRDLTEFKQTVANLKLTNTCFREFLKDLEDKTTPHTPRSKVHGDIEFEDFDDLFDVDVTPAEPTEDMKKDSVSAQAFLQQMSFSTADTDNMQAIIADLEGNIEAFLACSNKASIYKSITDDMRDLANSIFYIEEFAALSAALSDLATRMTSFEYTSLQPFMLGVFNAIVEDVDQWLNAVFIKKDTADIHYWDDSIVSSCHQVASFLKH